jgi:hypothetical protein
MEVDPVARSIEHDVLSVEPWKVRKTCSDFTPKVLRTVSRLASERYLALKEVPAILGCTL